MRLSMCSYTDKCYIKLILLKSYTYINNGKLSNE